MKTAAVLALAANLTACSVKFSESAGDGLSGSALLVVLGLIAVYLLPAVVASGRGHHQAAAIAALNVLLGWTFLGWVIALVCALTATPGTAASPGDDDF